MELLGTSSVAGIKTNLYRVSKSKSRSWGWIVLKEVFIDDVKGSRSWFQANIETDADGDYRVNKKIKPFKTESFGW